ncbi:MAG: hypothetical protein M3355_10140, partial [Actinomycetota bacterium]|nr:hypothetical protein [Actinomycetota bacterium]
AATSAVLVTAAGSAGAVSIGAGVASAAVATAGAVGGMGSGGAAAASALAAVSATVAGPAIVGVAIATTTGVVVGKAFRVVRRTVKANQHARRQPGAGAVVSGLSAPKLADDTGSPTTAAIAGT